MIWTYFCCRFFCFTVDYIKENNQKHTEHPQLNMYVLVGDIGGTNSRLQLFTTTDSDSKKFHVIPRGEKAPGTPPSPLSLHLTFQA